MKDYAKSFYHSKRWLVCREGYIQNRVLIDGGLCEVCKKNLGYILHHRVLLTEQNINDPEVTLSWDNLRWECKACHDEEEDHWNDSIGKRKPRAMFDANGQPIDQRKI